MLWGGLALVAVLLVLVAYQTIRHVSTLATTDPAVQEAPMQTAAIPDRSPSEALPTIRVLAENNDQATQRVAAEFKAAFSGFDTLDLIDGDLADQQARRARSYGLCADGGARPTSRAVSASS